MVYRELIFLGSNPPIYHDFPFLFRARHFGYSQQFLVEDYDSPVVFLDPTSYTFGGGGFATVAGVVLAALLVATLWYSWMWSGQQIESSGTATESTVGGGRSKKFFLKHLFLNSKLELLSIFEYFPRKVQNVSEFWSYQAPS